MVYTFYYFNAKGLPVKQTFTSEKRAVNYFNLLVSCDYAFKVITQKRRHHYYG